MAEDAGAMPGRELAVLHPDGATLEHGEARAVAYPSLVEPVSRAVSPVKLASRNVMSPHVADGERR